MRWGMGSLRKHSESHPALVVSCCVCVLNVCACPRPSRQGILELKSYSWCLGSRDRQKGINSMPQAAVIVVCPH